jgi:hypothetical protein
MTETDDNNTTSEWPWLTGAIKYVARCTDASCETAQEFLLTKLSGKRIRYRRHGHIDFGRDGLVFPEEYFFLCAPVHYEIDPDNTVIRTGPAVIKAQSDGEPEAKHVGEKDWDFVKPTRAGREEGWCFDSNRMVTTRMPLVQLCMEDIVWCLRAAGFVLPSNDPAQAELPLPTSPAPTAQAASPAPAAAEWDPNDPNAWTLPETVTLNLGLGQPRKAMRAVIAACRQLPERSKYKGKGVAEILIAMTPAELLKTIKCGSPDTCGRLIAALKAWCERHPRQPDAA